MAQHFTFSPNPRYLDPAVYVLDPSFEQLREFNSTLEQLGTGMRSAQGAMYLPGSKKLVLSDIANNPMWWCALMTASGSLIRCLASVASGRGAAPVQRKRA